MNAELEHIWSNIKAELAQTVEEPVFRIWLEPLRPLQATTSTLTLQASPQACPWVRERFGRVLQACVAAVLGPDITLDLVSADRPGGPAPAGSHPRPQRSRSHTQSSSSADVELPATHTLATAAPPNPKLTFDQFVIGDSNRLAHAAALAVSELPAQAYNPLFLCGPPGLGKTHLLHSISAFISSYNPGLQVRCTTGEAFTNDFILALNTQRLDSFKAGFRHVDVLLIDDVQFFERKTRTEEEFFHTFNSLYDAGSQIVLTSDRPPSDLQALEDRLRERFQSGLVADIRSPDLPTRLAILRKRAQHDGLDIADSTALTAIAERVTDNVRALEGALIRVVAFSSLTSRPLTAELALEVLDGLYPRRRPQARSIDDIQRAACEHFGVSHEELLSSSRAARIAWPRQVAMYLARELTSQSLPSIGREFGGRDHTTVMHALKRTDERIASNEETRKAVEELRNRLAESTDDRSA